MGSLRVVRRSRTLFRVSVAALLLLLTAHYLLFGLPSALTDALPEVSSRSFGLHGWSSGPRDDPLALQDNPGGAGYLVYGLFHSGDYTNRKMQLLEGLAMAAVSNRTLIVPWMCDDEPATYLYDAAAMHSAVGIIEDTSPWLRWDNPHQHGIRLTHFCGSEGIQLKLPHGFVSRDDRYAVKGDWRGVNWRLVNSVNVSADESLRRRDARGASSE